MKHAIKEVKTWELQSPLARGAWIETMYYGAITLIDEVAPRKRGVD